MKPLFTLFLLVFSFHAWGQPGCLPCPERIFLHDTINCNSLDLQGTQGTSGNMVYSAGQGIQIRACQNSIMEYNLYPFSNGAAGPCTYPGFIIDTVLVSGGVLVSNTNFTFTIQWGGSSSGVVQIQFHIAGGSAGNLGCTGVINLSYNLLPNPVAAFTASPSPACFNNPTNISFNSSASVGALSYFWNFGDGFTSTSANPVHPYTAPGTYTVCLTVTNTAPGNGTAPYGSCPSCSDSVCHTVVINSLPGPDISCIATVCAGESGTYCTSASCSTYNWVITGGVITSPNPSTSPCITVQWASGNPQGNIHLDVPGCPGFCSNGTDITVPIIPVSTTISGSSVVCVGTTAAYSLPTLPGTTYSWSISGGQPINGNNTNTTSINTTWNTIGTYTITCVYFDTALNCGGTGTLVVNVLPEMEISGPLKRCAGQSSNMNSHIVTPFTNVASNWSITPAGATINSGNGTATINVTWNNAGTYLVTATPVSGGIVCGPATFNVTVLPIPVISAITGADSICPAGTSVYAAVSNMAGLYTWTVTGGVAVNLGSNNDSIQVTWNPTGPYSITVTQNSYANNCPSLPFTKTVYPYPTPAISGAVNVCADATVTYTITNISSGFNWHITPAQFGTVLSAPGANPVQILWHGNNNPGFTHTVYLHYGLCNDDSIAINIYDPVIPVISQTGSLCPGGITLSVGGTGTYSWSHLENPPVVNNTNTLSGLNYPGHYSVNITNYNNTGCNLVSTINIPDIGRPHAQIFANGPLVYCNPNLPNMTLSAANVGGYTFQWFLGNTSVGTGPTLAVNSGLVPGNGTYVFKCVVTFNGCTDTSNLITISVSNCATVPVILTPCGAGFDITGITGCNPFTLSIGNLTPSGSTIVPGTVKVYHYEDGSFLFGNTTKVFNSVGYKQISICATILKPDLTTCTVCKDTFVTVEIASDFLAHDSCGTVYLTDLASVLAPVTIASYNWSVTPSGTFNNNTLASPVLTITSSGTYIITQTVTSSNGCITSSSDTVTITLPNADFLVSNSCVGTPVNLNNLFPALVNFWNFGDATSSNISPTQHAYAATGTYTITHTVTDALGCTATKSKPITIFAAPVCTITVTGSLVFCSGDSVKLTACAGYTSYQWKNNGVAISGATNSIFYATQTGNYSFTANDPLGCNVTSDTVSVTVNQSPSTSMNSTGQACYGELYTISVPSCTGCFYLWEVDGNFAQAGASNSYAETIGNAPFTVGPHLIKVTITGSNGCVSTDSVNVVFNPLPTVSITVTGNPPMLCSNNIYNFVASTNAASPLWAWTLSGFNNILSTTNTLNASVGGTYNVVVTDGLTGCTNSASQMIMDSPDLTLFPEGCDTLCQNSSITIPLASFNGNISGYTITWYDNAPPYTNIIGTGASISLNSLSLGAHNISVIVVGPNGCVDTSNVYYIYIVPATSSYTNASACGTYTWTVNGITYTASGIYTSTSVNASGCPQYDTLNLVITNGTGSSVTATACDSYTWTVNGVTYTLSGTYTYSYINPTNGCIHTDTLHLIIFKSTESALNITACGSYTWAANGVTYTSSGTYTFTGLNASGCIHTYILNLTITNGGGSSTSVTICASSYTWIINNATYTSSGTYTATYMTPDGCIFTDTLILVLNSGTTQTQSMSACDQYTWSCNGVTYVTSGIYTCTYMDANGCPVTSLLNLTIHHSTDSILTVTACASYTWTGNGVTYTSSGVYSYTSVNSSGCPAYFFLHLTITNGSSSTVNVTMCGSYTWPVNGQTYTASGTYTFSSMSTSGCPHYDTLHLVIHENTSSVQSVSACDMYTWSCNGMTYTVSGTYTCTSMNANGCIHTSTLILTISPTTVTTYNITACNSYTWPVNGQTYTTGCSFTVITQDSINGCAHVYVLCLTILPNTSSTVNITACDSYTWSLNGTTYTASGTYTHTSLNAYGCTHTTTLHLTILHGSSSTVTATACGSYTWLVNGQTYTASGVYSYTLLNPEGCTDTIYLNLTIVPGTNTSVSITACDSYTWNGVTYTASGTYTYTTVNAAGCIITHTLYLTINTTTITTSYITACNSYTWPVTGQTYTMGCIYYYSTIGENGCPHLYVLCLTIYQNTSSTSNITACNSYTWPVNNQTYTASGTYTFTYLNANGCTHTATLNLLINPSTSSSVSITSCGSYTWPVNGLTYTNSGTYTYTSVNTLGCPHVYTLVLQINPNTSATQNVVACDTYTWPVNGQTYTTSGIYTHTLLNANGCVHTITLYLVINHTSTGLVAVTACNSYTWNVNGVTYTASGIYTSVSINSQGCPHIIILQLTILPNTSSSVTVSACNSYTWPLNGQTYTASGVYTATSLNSNGCIHTTSLNLTIVPNTSSTITATACDTYTWPMNGLTYTQSGSYTYTSLNTTGCVHTTTLLLTIYHSTASTDSITTCNFYTWPVNGVTYTASGVYTATSTNSQGCLHTSTLVLTLNTTTLTSHCDTVCGPYTWPVNGVTYTTSGVYTYTTIGENGCPHIYLLCLTIYNPTHTYVQEIACEHYTWAVNGVTYTNSGTYTATVQNANGCTDTVTLNLTIVLPVITTLPVTACGSYTWSLTGATYTSSGNYSFTVPATGAVLCPHTYILQLTILENTNSVVTVNACEMYTWPVNGVTYTASGIYTHTSLNAAGCTHTATLILNLGTNTITTSSCDSACNEYYWPVNGVTYTATGVYTYITTGPNGCPHIYILCITIIHSTSSSTSETATASYTWAANGMTYTTSGTYTTTLMNTVNCDSVLTLNLTILQAPSAPKMAAKTLLSGPYDTGTGLMNDSLRVLGLIPLNEPYTSAPFYKASIGGGGGETTTASVLAASGANAIVDWIHVEIRSASNPAIILANRNALLQRDGDIVSSTDGISPLEFNALSSGWYYVSVKHRNHLGIMTAAPVYLQSSAVNIDFTSIALYVSSAITANTPSKNIGSTQLMWSGEDNSNKNVKYNGSLNDKDPILITVGSGTPNNTVYGYRVEDVNMDGKVRYNNTDNDRAVILNVVGATTPNKVLSQHTPN